MRSFFLATSAVTLTLATFGGPAPVENNLSAFGVVDQIMSLVSADEAFAARPAGHRFCERTIPFAEVKQRIRASISRDPSGNTRLAGCRARPIDYLTAYQQHVRARQLDVRLAGVADLMPFLDSLVELDIDRSVNYETDCLQDTDRGQVVGFNCEMRMIEPGERVYGLVIDGEQVALYYENCANPGSGDIVVTALRCVEVRFETPYPGLIVNGAHIGPAPLPGYCHELTVADGTDDGLTFTNYPEECQIGRGRRPRTVTLDDGRRVRQFCDWGPIEDNSTRVMGTPVRVQNVEFSFRTRAPGTAVWRLPVEALDGLPTVCWTLPDGTTRTLSVGRESFINGVAVITAEHMRTVRWQE